MQREITQLPLGLSLKDDATFLNFYSAKNAEIVAELQQTASGQGERIIYLCGVAGLGASHLLQACCRHAHEHQLTSVYLPLESLLTFSPEILSGLETLDLVCIDDLHLAATHPEWEEAIFHLYNRIYDAGGRIILAAHDLPKNIHMRLPDLVSRLSWGIVFQLHALSDDEKLAALTMRSNRRGIYLSDEVAKYILTHCSREMTALFTALDTLDKASLAAQRRLTIPFVKETLQIKI